MHYQSILWSCDMCVFGTAVQHRALEYVIRTTIVFMRERGVWGRTHNRITISVITEVWGLRT